MTLYPLSPQGVFCTIQGEGHFTGQPQVFVRLAGCNVGCPQCDTDYTIAERVTADEIAARCAEAALPGVEWVWVTGGEPTIHPLQPLYAAVRRAGFRIALATAGIADPHPMGYVSNGPDFVSVSPHRLDDSWKWRRGDQLNIVPGLNGLTLASLDASPAAWFRAFSYRYVTPLHYDRNGTTSNAAELAEWVKRRPGWRLGTQCHKVWGLP